MSNVDTAVTGRIFGATQLGYYQTAFALPEELRNRVVFAMQRVLFPAYALLQTDNSAFRQGVLKSLGLLGAITMPMGIGMVVLASPIVRTLYGEQWLPVIPLLQIVAIVGVVRAMHTLLGNIYKAKGRPDLDFKIGLAFAPLLLIGLFVGSHYGIVGVAIAVLVFNVLLLASNYLALRLIDLAAIDALASVVPATAAALVMGAGLLALDMARVMPRLPPLVELMLNAAIGSLLFIAALYLISPSTVRDLWTMRKFLRVRN
jgi:PST family polysaccharide transporter